MWLPKPSKGLVYGVGLGIASLLVTLFVTYLVAQEPELLELEDVPVEVQQVLQVLPGICLHEVVIFPNADSVGVVWGVPPCFDMIDVRERAHWDALERNTARLPRKCGIVFRLPGIPVPVVDTLPSFMECDLPAGFLGVRQAVKTL
jgi:hypothetical protein